MEGISIAIMRSELTICVELESLQAVNMLKEKEVDRSVFASLIAEIKYLLSLRNILYYSHQPKPELGQRYFG